jgi:hypothetical protein
MLMRSLYLALGHLLGRSAPSKRTFNPSLDQVVSTSERPILFIHVGKCAGTSIRNALLDVLPDGYVVHEMHCGDANRRILDVVENDNRRIQYVICARDPVARFVSAFNWGKHHSYLRGSLSGRPEGAAYERFRTIHGLVQGLQSDSLEQRELAINFARSTRLHMGMGQSWYTPLGLVHRLPPDRTSVIDSRSPREGVLNLLQKLGCPLPGSSWEVPWEKSDYKYHYPNHEDEFPAALSKEEKQVLGTFLQSDLDVYRFLLHYC